MDGFLDSVLVWMCYLLGVMSDDLPLELLSGAKLEVQLKEGQSGMKRKEDDGNHPMAL